MDRTGDDARELTREVLGVCQRGRRPVQRIVVDWLARHLGAQALCVRPLPRGPGWCVEHIHAAGPLHARSFETAFEQYLLCAPPRWTSFDPLRPLPKHRNTVVTDSGLRAVCPELEELDVVRVFYPQAGLQGLSQIRALVCDGPVLMTWVGAFREKPFDPGEVSAMRAIVEALQTRMRLDRALGGRAALPGVAAGLDAAGRVAFVTRPDGSLEAASRLGDALYAREGRELLSDIAASIDERNPRPRFTALRLDEYGMPDLRLVVLLEDEGEQERKLQVARRRWSLTPRQADVLDLLVRGEPNKTIAVQLGISPGTVELHVTALLTKSNTERRGEMAAAFWRF